VIKEKKLTKGIKIFTTIFLLLSVLLSIFYEYATHSMDEKNRKTVHSFNQGKILTCKEQNITNIDYIYEVGTSSFQPNTAKKEFVGNIYHIRECVVNP
jgi:predicted membrane protein